ncbi:MAG: DUF3160 domain-containing protein [bacterium]|nr:DUF3160 domain-containing protein [bacterium]
MKLPRKVFLAVDSLVNEELAKISARSGRFVGATGSGLDYTQFIVRGHYTRAPLTEDYFKAMMWYGLASFPLDSVSLEDPATILQSLLLCDVLFAERPNMQPLIQTWNKIYTITSLYVGESLHLTPFDLVSIFSQESRDKYLRPQGWVKKNPRERQFVLDHWR